MVEIIPKETKHTEDKGIIVFAISIFIVLILVSFYLYFWQAKKKIIEKEQTIFQEFQDLKLSHAKTEKEILAAKYQVDNFLEIMKNHKIVTLVFPLIEKNTFPNTWFDSFSLNVEKGEVQMSGNIDSFYSLGQQLIYWQLKQNELGKIEASGFKKGEKGVSFSLVLHPILFSYKPQIICPITIKTLYFFTICSMIKFITATTFNFKQINFRSPFGINYFHSH